MNRGVTKSPGPEGAQQRPEEKSNSQNQDTVGKRATSSPNAKVSQFGSQSLTGSEQQLQASIGEGATSPPVNEAYTIGISSPHHGLGPEQHVCGGERATSLPVSDSSPEPGGLLDDECQAPTQEISYVKAVLPSVCDTHISGIEETNSPTDRDNQGRTSEQTMRLTGCDTKDMGNEETILPPVSDFPNTDTKETTEDTTFTDIDKPFSSPSICDSENTGFVETLENTPSHTASVTKQTENEKTTSYSVCHTQVADVGETRLSTVSKSQSTGLEEEDARSGDTADNTATCTDTQDNVSKDSTSTVCDTLDTNVEETAVIYDSQETQVEEAKLCDKQSTSVEKIISSRVFDNEESCVGGSLTARDTQVPGAEETRTVRDIQYSGMEEEPTICDIQDTTVEETPTVYDTQGPTVCDSTETCPGGNLAVSYTQDTDLDINMSPAYFDTQNTAIEATTSRIVCGTQDTGITQAALPKVCDHKNIDFGKITREESNVCDTRHINVSEYASLPTIVITPPADDQQPDILVEPRQAAGYISRATLLASADTETCAVQGIRDVPHTLSQNPQGALEVPQISIDSSESLRAIEISSEQNSQGAENSPDMELGPHHENDTSTDEVLLGTNPSDIDGGRTSNHSLTRKFEKTAETARQEENISDSVMMFRAGELSSTNIINLKPHSDCEIEQDNAPLIATEKSQLFSNETKGDEVVGETDTNSVMACSLTYNPVIKAITPGYRDSLVTRDIADHLVDNPAIEDTMSENRASPATDDIVCSLADNPAIEDTMSDNRASPATDDSFYNLADKPAIETTYENIASPATDDIVYNLADNPAIEDTTLENRTSPVTDDIVYNLADNPAIEGSAPENRASSATDDIVYNLADSPAINDTTSVARDDSARGDRIFSQGKNQALVCPIIDFSSIVVISNDIPVDDDTVYDIAHNPAIVGSTPLPRSNIVVEDSKQVQTEERGVLSKDGSDNPNIIRSSTPIPEDTPLQLCEAVFSNYEDLDWEDEDAAVRADLNKEGAGGTASAQEQDGYLAQRQPDDISHIEDNVNENGNFGPEGQQLISLPNEVSGAHGPVRSPETAGFSTPPRQYRLSPHDSFSLESEESLSPQWVEERLVTDRDFRFQTAPPQQDLRNIGRAQSPVDWLDEVYKYSLSSKDSVAPHADNSSSHVQNNASSAEINPTVSPERDFPVAPVRQVNVTPEKQVGTNWYPISPIIVFQHRNERVKIPSPSPDLAATQVLTSVLQPAEDLVSIERRYDVSAHNKDHVSSLPEDIASTRRDSDFSTIREDNVSSQRQDRTFATQKANVSEKGEDEGLNSVSPQTGETVSYKEENPSQNVENDKDKRNESSVLQKDDNASLQEKISSVHRENQSQNEEKESLTPEKNVYFQLQREREPPQAVEITIPPIPLSTSSSKEEGTAQESEGSPSAQRRVAIAIEEATSQQIEISVLPERNMCALQGRRSILKRERSVSRERKASQNRVRFLVRDPSKSPPLQRRKLRFRRTKTTLFTQAGFFRGRSRGFQRSKSLPLQRQSGATHRIKDVQRENTVSAHCKVDSLKSHKNDLQQDNVNARQGRANVFRRRKNFSPQRHRRSHRGQEFCRKTGSSSGLKVMGVSPEHTRLLQKENIASERYSCDPHSKVRIVQRGENLSPFKNTNVHYQSEEAESVQNESNASTRRKCNVTLQRACFKASEKLEASSRQDKANERTSPLEECSDKVQSQDNTLQLEGNVRTQTGSTTSLPHQYRDDHDAKHESLSESRYSGPQQDEDLITSVDVDMPCTMSDNPTHPLTEPRESMQQESYVRVDKATEEVTHMDISEEHTEVIVLLQERSPKMTTGGEEMSALKLSTEKNQKHIDKETASENEQGNNIQSSDLAEISGSISSRVSYGVNTENITCIEIISIADGEKTVQDVNEDSVKGDPMTMEEQEKAELSRDQAKNEEDSIDHSTVKKDDGTKTEGQLIFRRTSPEVNERAGSLISGPQQNAPQDLQSISDYATATSPSRISGEHGSVLPSSIEMHYAQHYRKVEVIRALNSAVAQANESVRARSTEMHSESWQGTLPDENLPENSTLKNQENQQHLKEPRSSRGYLCDPNPVLVDVSQNDNPLEATGGQAQETSSGPDISYDQCIKTAAGSPEDDPGDDNHGKPKKKKKNKKKSKCKPDAKDSFESSEGGDGPGQASRQDPDEKNMSHMADEMREQNRDSLDSLDERDWETELLAIQNQFVDREVAMMYENALLKRQIAKMHELGKDVAEEKRQILLEKGQVCTQINAFQNTNSGNRAVIKPDNKNESKEKGPTHEEKIEWFEDQIRRFKPSSDGRGMVEISANEEDAIRIKNEVKKLQEIYSRQTKPKREQQVVPQSPNAKSKKKKEEKSGDNLPPCIHRSIPSTGTYVSKGLSGKAQKKGNKKTSSNVKAEDDFEETLRQFQEELKECGQCNICLKLREDRLTRQTFDVVRSENLTRSEVEEVIAAAQEEREKELAKKERRLKKRNTQHTVRDEMKAQGGENERFDIKSQQRRTRVDNANMVLLEEKIEEERERRALEKVINEKVKLGLREFKEKMKRDQLPERRHKQDIEAMISPGYETSAAHVAHGKKGGTAIERSIQNFDEAVAGPPEMAIKASHELISQEVESMSSKNETPGTLLMPKYSRAQEATSHSTTAEQTLEERKRAVSKAIGVDQVIIFGEGKREAGTGLRVDSTSSTLTGNQTSRQPNVQDENLPKPSCQRDLSFKDLIGAPYFYAGNTPNYPARNLQGDNLLSHPEHTHHAQATGGIRLYNRSSSDQTNLEGKRIPCEYGEANTMDITKSQVSEASAIETKSGNVDSLSGWKKSASKSRMATHLKDEDSVDKMCTTNPVSISQNVFDTHKPQTGDNAAKTDGGGLEKSGESTATGADFEQLLTKLQSTAGAPLQEPIIPDPFPSVETMLTDIEEGKFRMFEVYFPSDEERKQDSVLQLFYIPIEWLNSPSSYIQAQLFLVKHRGFRFTWIKGYPVFPPTKDSEESEPGMHDYINALRKSIIEKEERSRSNSGEARGQNNNAIIQNKEEAKEIESVQNNEESDGNVHKQAQSAIQSDQKDNVVKAGFGRTGLLPTPNLAGLRPSEHSDVSQAHATEKAETQQQQSQEIQSNIVSSTHRETTPERQVQNQKCEKTENEVPFAGQSSLPIIKEASEPGEVISSKAAVSSTPRAEDTLVLPGESTQREITSPQHQMSRASSRKSKSRREKRYKMAYPVDPTPEPQHVSKKNKKKESSKGVIEVSLESNLQGSSHEVGRLDEKVEEMKTGDIDKDYNHEERKIKSKPQEDENAKEGSEKLKNHSMHGLKKYVDKKTKPLFNQDDSGGGIKAEGSKNEKPVQENEDQEIEQVDHPVIASSGAVKKTYEPQAQDTQEEEQVDVKQQNVSDMDEESEREERTDMNKKSKRVKRMGKRQIKRRKKIFKAQAAAHFLEEKRKLEQDKQKSLQKTQLNVKTTDNDRKSSEPEKRSSDKEESCGKHLEAKEVLQNKPEEQIARQAEQVEINLTDKQCEGVTYSRDVSNKHNELEETQDEMNQLEGVVDEVEGDEIVEERPKMDERNVNKPEFLEDSVGKWGCSNESLHADESKTKDNSKVKTSSKISRRAAVFLGIIQDIGNIFRDLHISSDMHPSMVFSMLTSHMNGDYTGSIPGFNTDQVANPVGKHSKKWLDRHETFEPGENDQEDNGKGKIRVSTSAKNLGLILEDGDKILWSVDGEESGPDKEDEIPWKLDDGGSDSDDDDDDDDQDRRPSEDDDGNDPFGGGGGGGFSGDGGGGGFGGGSEGGAGGRGGGRRGSDGDSEDRNDSGSEDRGKGGKERQNEHGNQNKTEGGKDADNYIERRDDNEFGGSKKMEPGGSNLKNGGMVHGSSNCDGAFYNIVRSSNAKSRKNGYVTASQLPAEDEREDDPSGGKNSTLISGTNRTLDKTTGVNKDLKETAVSRPMSPTDYLKSEQKTHPSDGDKQRSSKISKSCQELNVRFDENATFCAVGDCQNKDSKNQTCLESKEMKYPPTGEGVKIKRMKLQIQSHLNHKTKDSKIVNGVKPKPNGEPNVRLTLNYEPSERKETDDELSDSQASNGRLSHGQTPNHEFNDSQATNDGPSDSQTTNYEPSDSQALHDEPKDSQTTNDEPSDSQATNDEPGDSQTTNDEPGDSPTTNDEPSDSQATNDEPSDSQATNDEPSDSQASNDEPSDSQATNDEPSDSQATNDEPSDSQATNDEPSDSQTTNDEPSDSQATNDEPSDSQTTNGEPSDSQATNDEPSDSQTTNDEPGDSQTTNDEPSDSQATNDEPSDSQATNDEPSDSQATNDEPSDSQATNDEPSDSQATNDEPSDSQASNDEPSDSQATNDEPSDSQTTNDEPSDSQATNDEPSDSQTTNDEPSDSQTTNDRPSDSQATYDEPTDSQTSDKPIDSQTTNNEPSDSQATNHEPSETKATNDGPGDEGATIDIPTDVSTNINRVRDTVVAATCGNIAHNTENTEPASSTDYKSSNTKDGELILQSKTLDTTKSAFVNFNDGHVESTGIVAYPEGNNTDSVKVEIGEMCIIPTAKKSAGGTDILDTRRNNNSSSTENGKHQPTTGIIYDHEAKNTALSSVMKEPTIDESNNNPIKKTDKTVQYELITSLDASVEVTETAATMCTNNETTNVNVFSLSLENPDTANHMTSINFAETSDTLNETLPITFTSKDTKPLQTISTIFPDHVDKLNETVPTFFADDTLKEATPIICSSKDDKIMETISTISSYNSDIAKETTSITSSDSKDAVKDTKLNSLLVPANSLPPITETDESFDNILEDTKFAVAKKCDDVDGPAINKTPTVTVAAFNTRANGKVSYDETETADMNGASFTDSKPSQRINILFIAEGSSNSDVGDNGFAITACGIAHRTLDSDIIPPKIMNAEQDSVLDISPVENFNPNRDYVKAADMISDACNVKNDSTIDDFFEDSGKHKSDSQYLASPEIPRTFEDPRGAQGTTVLHELPTNISVNHQSPKEIIVGTPSPQDTPTTTLDIQHPSPAQSLPSSPGGSGNMSMCRTPNFKSYRLVSPEGQGTLQEMAVSNLDLFPSSSCFFTPLCPSAADTLPWSQSPEEFHTPERISDNSSKYFTPSESMSSEIRFATSSNVFNTPNAAQIGALRSFSSRELANFPVLMPQDLVNPSAPPCNFEKFSATVEKEIFSPGSTIRLTNVECLPFLSDGASPISPTPSQGGPDLDIDTTPKTSPSVSPLSRYQLESSSGPTLRHTSLFDYHGFWCEDSQEPVNQSIFQPVEPGPHDENKVNEFNDGWPKMLWKPPLPDRTKYIYFLRRQIIQLALGTNPTCAKKYKSVVILELYFLYESRLHRNFSTAKVSENWLNPTVLQDMSELLSSIVSGHFSECVYLIDGKEAPKSPDPVCPRYVRPSAVLDASDPLRKWFDLFHCQRVEQLDLDLYYFSKNKGMFAKISVEPMFPVDNLRLVGKDKSKSFEYKRKVQAVPLDQSGTHKCLVSCEGHIRLRPEPDETSITSSIFQTKSAETAEDDVSLTEETPLREHEKRSSETTAKTQISENCDQSFPYRMKPKEDASAIQPSKLFANSPFSNQELSAPGVAPGMETQTAAVLSNSRSLSELQQDAFINGIYIPELMQNIKNIFSHSAYISPAVALEEAKHHTAVFKSLRPPTSQLECLEIDTCAKLVENLSNFAVHSMLARQVLDKEIQLRPLSLAMSLCRIAMSTNMRVDGEGESAFFQGKQDDIAELSAKQVDPYQVFNQEIAPDVSRNVEGNYASRALQSVATSGCAMASSTAITPPPSPGDERDNQLSAVVPPDVSYMCRFRGLGCRRCKNTGYTPDGIPCNEEYNLENPFFPSRYTGKMSSDHQPGSEEQFVSDEQEVREEGQVPDNPRRSPVSNSDQPKCFNCNWCAGNELKKCQSCQFVSYCSKLCQRKHLKKHQDICAHMSKFNEAQANLPDYIKKLIQLEKFKFINFFWDCPDVFQARGKRCALLAQIIRPCPNTNGSGFAFHIKDFIGNKAQLLFYLGLDLIYYLHEESSQSEEVRPLCLRLTPGTFVLVTEPIWSLFREGVGFRVDDMRNIFVLLPKSTPQEQQQKGKVGRKEMKNMKKKEKEDRQKKSRERIKIRETLKLWQEPNDFEVDAYRTMATIQNAALHREQDAALGLVNLGVESARAFGIHGPNNPGGNLGNNRAFENAELEPGEISRLETTEENKGPGSEECTTGPESKKEGVAEGESRSGSIKRGNDYDEASTGNFVFNEACGGEDRTDARSEGSTDTVSSEETQAQETMMGDGNSPEKKTTKSNPKSWKSKIEKKSKKGKKSKW